MAAAIELIAKRHFTSKAVPALNGSALSVAKPQETTSTTPAVFGRLACTTAPAAATPHRGFSAGFVNVRKNTSKEG